MVKLGLGLYRHMLTPENFRFARQASATHIVAHLVDYFNTGPRLPDTRDAAHGWGISANRGRLWTEEELRALRGAIEAEGLQLAAIENFDPSHWYDVLLDGPEKRSQLEDLKTIIRRAGRAGIPCIGYNFSIAAVWGHVVGPFARGGAESVAYLGAQGPKETPVPIGMVSNMVYDPEAPPGAIDPVTEDQMWQRVTDFLEAVIPVAEEAGVKLACHPEDPPVPTLRGTGRLLYRPENLQRFLEIVPSPYNCLEFCQGTVTEMAGRDLYDTIDRFSRQGKIAYVHFRNVRGTVPEYREVFLDEGDADISRALRIYKKNGFDGVMIPDHTPQMSCAAPWHAGMAYALGYMRAAINAVETE